MTTVFERLQAAGLPVVDAEPGETPHFSRLLTPAEELVRDSIISPATYRQAAARAAANAIPNWATWSMDDWNTYFSANLATASVTAVANLADAKAMLAKQNTVINALAQMVIALRDHTRIVE